MNAAMNGGGAGCPLQKYSSCAAPAASESPEAERFELRQHRWPEIQRAGQAELQAVQ